MSVKCTENGIFKVFTVIALTCSQDHSTFCNSEVDLNFKMFSSPAFLQHLDCFLVCQRLFLRDKQMALGNSVKY